MTGSPGFKSVIIAKLGREWIHGAQDVGQEVVSFMLPDNITLDGLKASIGTDLISDHEILFFDKLPGDLLPYTQFKYIPGQPVKMSIWVNSDSKLAGKRIDDL